MSNLVYFALVFLAAALISAVFGFGGLAGTAIESARFIFWIAIALFVASVVARFVLRGDGS
jgi:uncharacterized membrane protein YtjA (UPF0391 family)